MSTALVRHTPQSVALADTAPTFEDLLTMGNNLVRTGFLPDAIKNGAQAAAIILAGRELGMPPMRALRSLVLVKGKVTESADSQLSRFKSDGGRAVFKRLDETGAVLWLRHPNGDEHLESFSMADAKQAQLTGSGMYGKFPKAMLRSRAITAGLKSLGWEGGAGVYDPAELAPEPVADAEPDDIEEAVTEPAITDKQRALLDRIMSSHVFTDRERERAAAVQTKASAQTALDWATAQVKARKEAERSEDEAPDEDIGSDAAALMDAVAASGGAL